MPTHAEKRVLPYTSEQLFDLVADVERYPEFLPWCIAVRVRERKPDLVVAETLIGFKMVRERFTSRVELKRPSCIDVTFAEGPFRYLNNHWVFTELPDGGCEIDFFVDFEFRSAILQKLIGLLFNEAVRRMVTAFEGRAKQLYGDDGRAAAAKRA